MDAAYIRPFLDSVNSVFVTMLGVQPQPLEGRPETGPPGAQLTSLIGISGSISGMVLLRFPPQTALNLAGRMLSTRFGGITDEVIDAISEIVNMVAGSAKARFDSHPPLQLGLPTVVEGAGYRVKYPRKSVLVEVAFRSEAGEFSLEVTYCAP